MRHNPATRGFDEAARTAGSAPGIGIDQPTVVSPAVEPRTEPQWLAAARAQVASRNEDGQFIAFDSDGGFAVMPIREGWSRVGRSASADIRFDDATVSRRHAQLVRTPEARLSVLDDRSLNGVYVNGERVQWSELSDGDEIGIGRYRLHVIDLAPTP